MSVKVSSTNPKASSLILFHSPGTDEITLLGMAALAISESQNETVYRGDHYFCHDKEK
ncbi:MAG: hypothetical protein GXP08_05210 [Gammaproteobacteria bacterium]|nr:hypothetical protein [Gammaproteobacteria bacterium]